MTTQETIDDIIRTASEVRREPTPLIDAAHLRRVFSLAARAARLANDGEDGGTCNLDSAVLRVNEIAVSAVETAAPRSGITATRQDWLCSKGEASFFLSAAGVGGQGDARTRSMEAIRRVLEATGYVTSMYWQMD